MRLQRPTARGDLAILWISIALLMAAGAYIAFFRIGAAIVGEQQRSADVVESALADARIIAERPILLTQADVLSRKIGALELNADHAALVARFIARCTKLAVANRVTVVQIDERPVADAPALTARPAPGIPPDSFETVALDVTLSGAYPDIIAMMRGLAGSPLALDIQIATLDRTSAPGAPSALTAHLRVRLQRLAAPALQRTSPVLPPELTNHA